MKKISVNDIDLIIYDFDGVMTDNRVLITENGEEAVFVNRSDGMAVRLIKEMGLKQIIISTEKNPAVAARAKKLGLPVIHDVKDKQQVVEKYLAEQGINKERVAFVGNDLNDKEAMEYVGWPVAPADAAAEIIALARIVLKKAGGQGVVRELLDVLREGLK